MLSFAQPWFLLALGALILPPLIHRISRSRPIAWPFPSIRRIRKSPLPRQGKRRISDWPLLLLRLLLLALFILALAGPTWVPESSTPAATSGQARALVLVDASSSMSGWGAPAQVREQLALLEETFAQSSWGWIVWADAVMESAPPSPENRLSLLRAYLEENPPLPVVGFPADALREALDLLAGSEGRRRIHIISDFQESDWSQSRLPEIPSGIEVHLHSVGSERRGENLTLQRVLSVPAANNRTRVLATAMNFGVSPVESSLRLRTAEGQTDKAVTLPPGQPQTESFLLSADTPSSEASMEIITADPYPRDNRVTFSTSAPAAPEVLAVDPEGGLVSSSEEVFFLTQALGGRARSDWSGFDVLPAGLAPVNPETLRRISAVFLPANAFANPNLPWDVLKSYIQDGGLVVATMGNEAVKGIDNLNRAGFPEIGYRGIAGRGLRERFFVGPLPDGSLLAEVFTGEATRDLFLVGIFQHARLTLPLEADPLLVSTEGDPLLTRIPLGAGHLVLATFPFDRSVSDLPLRPSFLPIVREVFGLARNVTPPAGESGLPDTLPLSESLPQRMPENTVQRLLRGGSSGPGAIASPGQPSLRSDAPVITLAPWLLLLALLVFITECLLARRLIART